MSPLSESLADYLAMRRALGYRLERAAKLLAQFLGYLEERGEQQISTELALAWATVPAGGGSWHSYRLSAVRGFARYLHAIDAAVEVPAADLLPDRPHRATPYLYSDAQIAALIAAAATLATPHRVATLQAMIGLLSVTGMRVGEAIALDRCDLDARNGSLVIREAKFGKSRELPLDQSVVDALRRYLRRRDRPQAQAPTPALLVSSAGTRLLYTNVQNTFHRLVQRAGLQPRSANCRPRLHDLRHTFAVATILDGYRAHGDVGPRLALLATYLGHVDPGKTYWYLEAAPELMQLAAGRLERHLGAL
jgi:integrase